MLLAEETLKTGLEHDRASGGELGERQERRAPGKLVLTARE